MTPLAGFRRPTPRQIDTRLEHATGLPFSYGTPGLLDDSDRQLGFQLDHYRTRLGGGGDCFDSARAAVRANALQKDEG